MPKLRRISGRILVSILLAEGFVKVRQKGSHVRLVKRVANETYFLTVPLHPELDRGTLKAILRSLERCVSVEKLRQLFYTE